MPLIPPGPKSRAWVAVSGNLVALTQFMVRVKIWSLRDFVNEPVSVRRSDPREYYEHLKSK